MLKWQYKEMRKYYKKKQWFQAYLEKAEEA